MWTWLLTLLLRTRSVLRPRGELMLENLALRQQLAMLKRLHPRVRPSKADRLFWIVFYRSISSWRSLLHVLHPDTVIRWHRIAFRYYWTHRGLGMRCPLMRRRNALKSHCVMADLTHCGPCRGNCPRASARRLIPAPLPPSGCRDSDDEPRVCIPCWLR